MKAPDYFDFLRDKLVANDLQKWIPWWGPTRSTKTTGMYWVAKWINPDFDVEEHMSWTADDHVDKALHAKRGEVLLLDEPIKGMMSFDATSGANKELYRAATVIGERNLVHMTAHVSFKRYPKPFLEDFCEEGIHVVGRGMAEIRRVVDSEANEILWQGKTPGRHMDGFDYPPMPKKDESRYRKLKTEFVQEHRDAEGYSEVKRLEREMDSRLGPIMKRHAVAAGDVDDAS